MTRIVAGVARGRRLAVPSRGTRPTSERAREALFNSLRSIVEIDGARVLDLFAGSGAVGLEALSRGAAEVVLVESDARAAATIRANIAAVALPGARLSRRAVAAFLTDLADPADPAAADCGADGFDFVFLDPPYAMAAAALDELLALIGTHRWLAPGGVVVVERAAHGPGAEVAPAWPAGVDQAGRRRYGAGVLWYGRAR